MKIKVNSKIGKTSFQFEIEERDERETLHKAIVLSNFPQYCHVCKNTEVFKLDSNKDKQGNVYVNVVCKCGAKAKLGLYKTGGYFWHKFEVYQKNNTNNTKAETVKEHFNGTISNEPDDAVNFDDVDGIDFGENN